jgi:chemotaxis protein CheX
MPTATAESLAELLSTIDSELSRAVAASVQSAMAMCETRARCVGLSAVPAHETGIVTGMIGVHGRVSGFITVNMSERFAVKAVGGLLQESYGGLTSQVVDGVGEITNIIVGGVKATLASTPWGFSNITVPSVIVGKGYHIAYARGLTFVCTTFECDDPEALMLEDRLMQVSLSLLRL